MSQFLILYNASVVHRPAFRHSVKAVDKALRILETLGTQARRDGAHAFYTGMRYARMHAVLAADYQVYIMRRCGNGTLF